jgi:hypothetical protein
MEPKPLIYFNVFSDSDSDSLKLAIASIQFFSGEGLTIVVLTSEELKKKMGDISGVDIKVNIGSSIPEKGNYTHFFELSTETIVTGDLINGFKSNNAFSLIRRFPTIVEMRECLNSCLLQKPESSSRNDFLNSNVYKWKNGFVCFAGEKLITTWGQGTYNWHDAFTVSASFGGFRHFLRFFKNYTSFMSIRYGDCEIVRGEFLEKKIIQTEKNNGFNLYFYDDEWQKPVITEYQSFLLFKKNKLPDNYFAFPWASLIDRKLKSIKILENFKILDKSCFTIMQHIHFKRLLPLLQNIGITHVFTPHTRPTDNLFEEKFNIKIIPYTLFPAQCIESCDNSEERPYLANFIGQYAPHYISMIREKIFSDFLFDDCLIIRRKEWHYNGMVYLGSSATGLEKEEEEYKSALKKSKFSLCPSGSGPNSIRIWESMGYGCIPVLLADTLKLPTLKNVNWADCFVLLRESEFDTLHDRLLSFSEEKIKAMQKKNIELFDKYFSKDRMINVVLDWYNAPLLFKRSPIISYCCDTFPSVGGVARYESQLKLVFPNRKFFRGPGEKQKMLDYLKSKKSENPIVITDNHLACDIPNDYKVFIVHHGVALTHAEREPTWDKYWTDLCSNGQKQMLYQRCPAVTQIISCSQFCTDEFTRHFPDRYSLFKHIKILHSSELDESVFKTSFNEKPVVLGNWGNSIHKGGILIKSFKSSMPEFTFKQLTVNPLINETLENFNRRKQKIYTDSDIFLQISLCEGYSYSALDALLCGLVVVSSDVGLFYKDLPDDCFVKLDWRKNGDAEYVKERLAYAWANRKTLGKNARSWYMKNVRFKDWARKMNECLI